MQQEENFEKAAARVSYRLVFDRAEKPREFEREALLGPPVPDAYGGPRLQNDEWIHPPHFLDNGESDDGDAAVSEWIAHFLSMAIGNAVHEVLEFFHVDGKPYLDPHGPQEEVVHILVNEMALSLTELAEGKV